MTPRISTLVKIDALARRYSIATITLRRLIAAKVFPVYVVTSKLWRFDLAECDAALAAFYRAAKPTKSKKRSCK